MLTEKLIKRLREKEEELVIVNRIDKSFTAANDHDIEKLALFKTWVKSKAPKVEEILKRTAEKLIGSTGFGEDDVSIFTNGDEYEYGDRYTLWITEELPTGRSEKVGIVVDKAEFNKEEYEQFCEEVERLRKKRDEMVEIAKKEKEKYNEEMKRKKMEEELEKMKKYKEELEKTVNWLKEENIKLKTIISKIISREQVENKLEEQKKSLTEEELKLLLEILPEEDC